MSENHVLIFLLGIGLPPLFSDHTIRIVLIPSAGRHFHCSNQNALMFSPEPCVLCCKDPG